MPRIEQLRRLSLLAPSTARAQSASNQFAGIALLANATATLTVSTTTVKSDSIIRYGVRATPAPGSTGLNVIVSTISPKNFFTFATADGMNAPRDLNLMWEIVQST
jgi:hypothetical protein